MTTIITRLYEDDAAANAVASGLSDAGFPASIFDVIAGGGDVAGAMATARVSEEGAAVYGPLIDQGKKLVVVRAPITPFGAAKRAMSIVDSQPTVDTGLKNQDQYVREAIVPETDAPFGGGKPRTSAVGKEFKWSLAPIPLLMNWERQNSCFSGTKCFGAFLVPLHSKNRFRIGKPVFQRTKRFGAFIMPLLNKRKPLGKTILTGDKRFADFLVPLLVK